MKTTEQFYHVTVLSNFARGFDKYSRTYSKEQIRESTFPNQFFLLRRDEVHIGVTKAQKLLQKLNLPGDRLLILEAAVDARDLNKNTASNLGQFVNTNRVTLSNVYDLDLKQNVTNQFRPLTLEEAMAASLRLLNPEFAPFSEIRPRAISFLPVALACQAKCPFCFSKSSASSDQINAAPNWERIQAWLVRAKALGAERAVITGGGEPTLLQPTLLEQLVSASADHFGKVVLITNSHRLAMAPPSEQATHLAALYQAGLRVLAISRHHFDPEQNTRIMNLHTPAELLIETWGKHRDKWPELRLRLICVLQQNGVNNLETLKDYVSWATNRGVEEVCFKELYVSTSVESVYHDLAANQWSRQHQVPLSLITNFAAHEGFTVENRLPWGAPVYRGEWLGKPIRIAAYTEPSLFWERANKTARSWNVMADGHCYASLEDRLSEIQLKEAA